MKMNKLKKAKELGKEFDWQEGRVDMFSENGICGEFGFNIEQYSKEGKLLHEIKERTNRLLEEINKEIISEYNGNFIDRELMKQLEEAKKTCEEILK